MGENGKRVLERDPKWVKLHKQRITKTLKGPVHNVLYELAEKERRAFDLAIANQFV